MTICHHSSIHAQHYGAISKCISCRGPIIFDGTAWRWLFGIDHSKVRKMRTAWEMDELSGKHVTRVTP